MASAAALWARRAPNNPPEPCIVAGHVIAHVELSADYPGTPVMVLNNNDRAYSPTDAVSIAHWILRTFLEQPEDKYGILRTFLEQPEAPQSWGGGKASPKERLSTLLADISAAGLNPKSDMIRLIEILLDLMQHAR